jgi:hypothetical protein
MGGPFVDIQERFEQEIRRRRMGAASGDRPPNVLAAF